MEANPSVLQRNEKIPLGREGKVLPGQQKDVEPEILEPSLRKGYVDLL